MANPVVTFEMENGDIMKAELYPELAPNTVKNFVSLVSKGYYDGLVSTVLFLRVHQSRAVARREPERVDREIISRVNFTERI